MAAQKLDPKALPSKADERHRVSRELLADARQAMERRETLVASLAIADALMLFPSDPELLDTFGRLAGSVPDALALFPVATGRFTSRRQRRGRGCSRRSESSPMRST